MKNKRLLYTALSASLLLAACGTDTSEEDNGKTTIESTDQTEDTGTEGSETENNETDGKEGAEGSDTSEENTASEDEGTSNSDAETDSSESEDPTALEGAKETESDEQDFKMQVLPSYELTSEEPGRDILYLKEHEDKYMVVGTMKASDIEYEDAIENMKETLAATSPDASPMELTDPAQLPTDATLENVHAFRVASPEGPITAMIFKKGDLVSRVMMYDDNDESYYDEFLKMAETIQPK